MLSKSLFKIILGLNLFFICIAVLPTVSGNIITDLPQMINDIVFEGEEDTLSQAKLILSCTILVSIILALAVFKMNLMGMTLIMTIAVICLTAIAWLDYWVLFVYLIIIGAMWGTKIASWFPR